MSQDVAVEPWRAEIERVFRADGTKMWRTLLAFTGDPEVASDAVAEAFAQALARGPALRSPSHWIWRASYLIARRFLNERPRYLQGEDATVEMPEPVWDIVVALRSLSPNQRMVVLLHDYVGVTTREVAAAMGIKTATARVHLANGRRRLRQLLEDE